MPAPGINRWWLILALGMVVWTASAASYRPGAKGRGNGDELFNDDSGVRHLRIEIDREGMETLRRHSHRAREQDGRQSVPVTVREGDQVWTNVSLHLKGALGSFRPVDDRPALTLNFDKLAPGQRFHGLQKISLNNSVQDRAYLNEKLCREIYNAGGVPTPRADYATLELNGRNLGLYLLVEGWNKQFLKRHFEDTRGNFYDNGQGKDVSSPAPAAFGENPASEAKLRQLAKAAGDTNLTRRFQRIRESLDLDRFLRLHALDVMMWNWDGYGMNKNNYRMFHDLEQDRIVFFPHGVDQMFWKVNGPIMTGRSGLLVKALLETEEGRRLYLRHFADLRTNVFQVSQITNRLAQLSRRIRPALAQGGLGAVASQEAEANLLRSRILLRARDVDRQLAGAATLQPMALDVKVPLTNWVARKHYGDVRTDQDGGLHLLVRNETSFGSWSALTWLEQGRYVVEGRVKSRGVQGGLRNEQGGVGFRIWSDRKDTRGASWGWFPYGNGVDRQLGGLIPAQVPAEEQRLTGDNNWTVVRHEFELRQPLADLHIQCALQAAEGEAWFDPASITIRRVSWGVSKATVKGE